MSKSLILLPFTSMKKRFAKTLPSKLTCCLQNEGLFVGKNGSQEANFWVLEHIRGQALIVLPCAKYHCGLVMKERIIHNQVIEGYARTHSLGIYQPASITLINFKITIKWKYDHMKIFHQVTYKILFLDKPIYFFNMKLDIRGRTMEMPVIPARRAMEAALASRV